VQTKQLPENPCPENQSLVLTTALKLRNPGYGRTNYYALGEHAASIKALTNRATLTLSDVNALEDLGFRCVIVGRHEMPASEVIGVLP